MFAGCLGALNEDVLILVFPHFLSQISYLNQYILNVGIIGWYHRIWLDLKSESLSEIPSLFSTLGYPIRTCEKALTNDCLCKSNLWCHYRVVYCLHVCNASSHCNKNETKVNAFPKRVIRVPHSSLDRDLRSTLKDTVGMNLVFSLFLVHCVFSVEVLHDNTPGIMSKSTWCHQA